MAKVCVVSSCGGHLTEIRCLVSAYQDYSHVYVLNGRTALPADMVGKTYFVAHSERDWKFLLNLWEALGILWRERPAVLLSTGAGVIVPFALVGRFLFGCHIIFIETITRVDKPSLTARIMYRLADEFYYQWPSLAKFFPRGRCGGALL